MVKAGNSRWASVTFLEGYPHFWKILCLVFSFIFSFLPFSCDVSFTEIQHSYFCPILPCVCPLCYFLVLIDRSCWSWHVSAKVKLAFFPCCFGCSWFGHSVLWAATPALNMSVGSSSVLCLWVICFFCFAFKNQSFVFVANLFLGAYSIWLSSVETTHQLVGCIGNFLLTWKLQHKFWLTAIQQLLTPVVSNL